MKNLLLALITSLAAIGSAQTFNNVFDNPFLNIGGSTGYSLHLIDDTLHIFGTIATQDSSGIVDNIHLRYDLDGNLIDYSVFDPEDPELNANLGLWGGVDLFNKPDSVFFTAPYAEFINFEENPNEANYIQFINKEGEEILKSEIDWHPNGYTSKGARSISENEHLIYGTVWDEGGLVPESNNGFVLSCNSQGELNWVQRYENTNHIRFMEKTGDNGFILGGTVWWDIEAGEANSILDCIVIKSDSLGQEQWRYIFGDTEGEAHSPVISHSNNNIYSLSVDAITGPDRGPIWFQKIQDYGSSYEVTESLLWSNPELFDHAPFGIKEVSDGGIVGFGFGKEKWDEEIGDVPPSGFIYKVTPDLDSLWKRYYQHFIPEVDANHAFHDMVEGPDSCLYLTGRAARGEGTGLFDLGHIWLMKVDSYGCLEPGCHLLDQDSTDNIVQIIGLQNSLKIYPNPVRDQFNLELELPPEFSPPSSSVLKLIDMNGREVKQIELGNIAHQHVERVDISELAAGTYTLHWMNAGLWYDSTEIIKH